MKFFVSGTDGGAANFAREIDVADFHDAYQAALRMAWKLGGHPVRVTSIVETLDHAKRGPVQLALAAAQTNDPYS